MTPRPHDVSIPVLPSRSLKDTLAFYRRLGFDGEIHPMGEYLIVARGPLELHFFTHPTLFPADSWAGCYLRVSEVDRIYAEMSAAKLPLQGIPRMDVLESKPWGMRKFAIVDADGNLVKVGEALARRG